MTEISLTNIARIAKKSFHCLGRDPPLKENQRCPLPKIIKMPEKNSETASVLSCWLQNFSASISLVLAGLNNMRSFWMYKSPLLLGMPNNAGTIQ